MKTKLVLLAAAFVFSQSAAFAQSTTNLVIPESTASAGAAATNTAVNIPIPPSDDRHVKPELKYLGYMHGVGADFSGAHEAGINGNSQMNYEQRVYALIATSKKFEFGVQARVMTDFANGNTLNVQNGNWRLVANFNHVYQDDVFNLTISPRVYLPTSNAARNQKITPSPDLVAMLDVAPKNTRFSGQLGFEGIQEYHTAGAEGTDYTQAYSTIIAPWAEIDYQLTGNTQLMLSYWPEYNAQSHVNAPLTSNWNQGGGNEVDIGGYYEFVKGWQFMPFLATEMSQIGANGGSVAKNMQINFLIIGQIL
jgi:hypothetical protein